MSSKLQKSNYQPKLIESDGTIDATITKEINGLLEIFFKPYPSVTEKQLSYYVNNQTLSPINKDYVFSELMNQVYIMEDTQMIISFTVKYLDQETKVTNYSQFELTL